MVWRVMVWMMIMVMMVWVWWMVPEEEMDRESNSLMRLVEMVALPSPHKGKSLMRIVMILRNKDGADGDCDDVGWWQGRK